MLGLFFLSTALHAGTPEIPADQFGERLTLSQALNWAVRHNPRIKGLSAKWDAMIERYRIQTGLPDPTVNLTWFPSPIETRLGPQDYNITLSQGIPFPGKLRKKGAIVEKESLLARLKLDREIKDIRTRVVKSYAELGYIRSARQIAHENMAIIDAMAVQAEQTYARDRGVLMDLMRARSQKGQLQYDLILLEEIETSQEADLNALMNRPVNAPVGCLSSLAVLPLAFSHDEIFAKALENNDSINISRALVEKADAGVDLANTVGLPDFKLGLFYAGIGEPENNIADAGKDAVGIRFGMTLPLWSGKNSGRKMAALHEKKAAQAERIEMENRIKARISNTLFKLENASRLITLYREDLLPQAMAGMDAGELWFRENKGAFTDFLEAQGVVHNFQLALARARADYIKTLADLENLAGISLVAKEVADAK